MKTCAMEMSGSKKLFGNGKYAIKKRLGSGTFGNVYLGVSKTSKTKAAIKFVDPDWRYTAGIEAEALRLCHHEHVLKLYEASTEEYEEVPYMVLELMKRSMASVRRPFTHDMIKRIMHQLLEAVEYCHQQDYGHLDIKPDNILLDEKNNNVKLADLGLAISIRGKYRPSIAYAALYRPPELVLGATQYDPAKTDMWAVGMVFAFMLLKNKHLYRLEKDAVLPILEEQSVMFGKPDECSWPGIEKLQGYPLLSCVDPACIGLRQTFKARGCMVRTEEFNLLERLLCLDPKQRLSATEALASNYFS